MLQLQQLNLTQFRNYGYQTHRFSKKVVGIAGPNGSGKTNLLDAIYYLCFTKSYFAAADAQLVQQGQAGFRIEGQFSHPLLHETPVTAILRETGKKEVACQGEVYSRMAAHIGKLPAVIIAPDDVSVVTGGSEERRKLFDALVCQLNQQYLQSLMEYNKLLLQRNSLLRQMAEQGGGNMALLDVLDQQMASRAQYIYTERQAFLAQFLPQAVAHYHSIAQGRETIGLSYESPLHLGSMASLLQQQRPRDMAAQRTTTGIHRDDIKIELLGRPFKQFASQGQRKSLLFALKLTEFELLQQHKGFAPLLLLDDVFEKLDGSRMWSLLQEVCLHKKGQVFITDTHADRLTAQLEAIGADFEIFITSH
ncbi:MAG: DNA replication and repair protein RecF [Bacteroidetes bacterium]|nr:MAG: DNA replication and repair protein RecF [Bacteroidota bacterium]